MIEVKSGYNVDAFSFLLKGYSKEVLVMNGIKYGWQLNWACYPRLCGKIVPNHPTVEREFPLESKKWFQDQVEKGMLIGPIKRSQIPWPNITTHPLHSVMKDETL